jgi:RimJ/RimL family protein N-acetyltransferase
MGISVFNNVFLETKRLILKNFTHEDKDDFFHITRDTKIYETLPDDHMYSMEEISKIIDWFIYQYDHNTLENIPKFPLAIFLKKENALIGNIGIGHYSGDESMMEIFYFLNSQYWNKGFMTEAFEIFLEYVKKHKFVSSLIGAVVPKNIASIKILEKKGFKAISHEYNDKRIIYELVF